MADDEGGVTNAEIRRWLVRLDSAINEMRKDLRDDFVTRREFDTSQSRQDKEIASMSTRIWIGVVLPILLVIIGAAVTAIVRGAIG